HTLGNGHATDHQEQRMVAEGDRHRAGFAARPVLLHDAPAVLALGDHDAQRAGVVALDTVGAAVDPAAVGIFLDHQAAGADVVAAVLLVPARRREVAQVHLLADLDAFLHRPVLDGFERQHGAAGVDLPPGLDQVDLGDARVEAAAQRHPRRRGQHVADDAVARLVARDVVEQHRRVAGALHEDVHDGADLQLRAGAVDFPQLAQGPHLVEPAAQGQIAELHEGTVYLCRAPSCSVTWARWSAATWRRRFWTP